MLVNLEQCKVSVIVPMYNCELYIERCLKSILNQTYLNIEVLVVDDGSQDNSAELVKKFAKEKSKIKYIYQNNSGPGTARNKAIEMATGKYLLFVDADDYISDDYVECMVTCAEKNNSELVIAGYTLVFENKSKRKVVIPKKYEKNIAEEWAYRISSCCSRMYLKKFWDINELKFHEEKNARAEDVPIVLYSNAMAKNISIVKNPGYYYYQHSGSAMNNKKKKVLFEFPYEAFADMYKKVNRLDFKNSRDFFDIGVLKFLAHFDLVIYRKADKKEKNKFRSYICRITKEKYESMICSWKKERCDIDFSFVHKMAIEVFLLRYNLWRKKWLV